MINEKNNSWKAAKVMVWVKTSDGNTWLCPKNAIVDPKNLSEDELKKCLDESNNPQNN